MLKIYNSLTNKVEDFHPRKEGEVSIYVCGSTVYDNMHIGNSRPIVFFDTVARFFSHLGYKVKFVSNFTDIDDKIIQKAEAENSTEAQVAARYIKSILDTYKKLNVLPHYKNPQVTEYIPEIISFIQLLIKNGGAYIAHGDVYFSIDKVADYGVLSGQSKDKLIHGARIDSNDLKKHPGDFNLWKETKTGLNFSSPWSEGRPGWHTECVVMIDSIFKGPIDIHGGGLDLKFPHHDNEIAQAEVAFNHKIASIWMHNGRIDLAGEKMSKSLGNIIWAHELVDEIGYPAYRLMLLNVPYRQPLNFKEELITQAQNDLDKINRPYITLKRILQIDYNVIDLKDKLTIDKYLNLHQEFINEMSNDFNTANAISVIHKLVKEINILLRKDAFILAEAQEALHLFEQLTNVLGILEEVKPLTEEEINLVKLWRKARSEKDFVTADKYRADVQKMGVMF